MNLIDKTPQYDVPEFIQTDAIRVTLDAEAPKSIAKLFEIETEGVPSGFTISTTGTSSEFKAGDIFAMAEDLQAKQFRILDVIKTTHNGTVYTNLNYKCLTDDEAEVENENGKIFKISRTQSATAEVPYTNINNYDSAKYENFEHTIADYATFDETKNSLPFAYDTAKLKFFARTPGEDGNSIDIAIANADDFNKGKYIKTGLTLDGQFDYTPYGNQFAIIVLYQNEIVESFIVSFDETAKNDKNEFIFVETIVNKQSNYILVKVNENLPNTIKTCLDNELIKLSNGSYSEAGADDIIDGYNSFSNKEELDVDIVIGNEVYQKAATDLAISRADCIAYIGAPRSCSVGLKSSAANTATVQYRKDLNIDSKYVTLNNNYKYQYCAEFGDNRWINLAGDIAGLKAQSNFNNYTWYAAAGLNRGNIKNVVKLAYSPDGTQRDELYKNGINPCVIFPNTGAVLWGQKTLQTKASSFDRVNVVALFNYLERSLARMSKYALFEFNDSFTRSYVLSLVKPFLAQVKSGRGIADYLTICDESNNTAQVIANNQFILDIYVKPNYSAEYIYLRFTNVGTNDFSIVTGSAS